MEFFDINQGPNSSPAKGSQSKEEIIKTIKEMPVKDRKTKIIKQQVENWISNNSDDENLERDIENAFRLILSEPYNDPSGKATKIKNQVLSWLAEDQKSQKIRNTVLQWSGGKVRVENHSSSGSNTNSNLSSPRNNNSSNESISISPPTKESSKIKFENDQNENN